MQYDLKINSFYNLTLFAPGIIGNDYKNVQVAGLLNYASAINIADVAPIHAAVLSSLPQGTPSNPKDLTFVKLITSSDETRVIAMDWISSEPVLIQSTNINVRILGADISKISLIRQLLIANGFPNLEITTS